MYPTNIHNTFSTRSNNLLASKNIWKEIINRQKDGFIILNNDFSINTATPNVFEFLSIDKQQPATLINSCLFLDRTETPFNLEQIIKCIKEGKIETFTCKYATNKEEKTLDFSLLEGIDFDGYALQISQSAANNSKKFEPENILTLIENLSDGFWIFDVATHAIEFSPKWGKELGEQEVSKTSAYQWWLGKIHPKEVQLVKENFMAFISGESEHYTSIFRIKVLSGTYKWIRENGKVLEYDKEGLPRKLIVSVSDVEKQKSILNTLNESVAREQELVDLKTRFVSMASHEFRTPLATILLSVETLEAYWNRMDKESIDSKMQRIKNNVIFLKNVIENVLSLTHAESGKIRVNKSTVDIYQLINNIVYEYTEIQKAPNSVSIYSDFKEIPVLVDKQLMEQVFKNLISNAIKYTPEGQEVSIAIRDTDQQLKVAISDKGIGISEEDQINLFTPFFRGKNVANIRGTGLGLSLTKEFIELHHGQLEVQSIINKGSTFTVILPK